MSESAPERLRVGLVGAGRMAHKHLERLATMADVEVAAICDVVEERARALALPRAARTFSDPERMLAETDLHAVYVLVPPFARGAAERAALRHRVPFFVEKPVGLDLGACREIAAAVAEMDLLTCVGYMNRYRESVLRARAVFRSDPVVLACGGWVGGPPDVNNKYDAWRWSVEKGKGGGQFVDEASHAIDLLRYLVGEVTEVFAQGVPPRAFNREVPPNYDIEDAVVATLKFESGAVAALWATCASTAGGGVSLSVFGTRHAAYFTGWKHALRLVERPRGGGHRTEETFDEEADAIAAEDRSFVDAVRSGDRSLIRSDYADGVRTAEVALAVNRALDTGRPVDLRAEDVAWQRGTEALARKARR